MAVELQLRDAEVLAIGEKDRLVIITDWDDFDEWVGDLATKLDEIGLKGRYLIIDKGGSEISFAKTQPVEA